MICSSIFLIGHIYTVGGFFLLYSKKRIEIILFLKILVLINSLKVKAICFSKCPRTVVGNEGRHSPSFKQYMVLVGEMGARSNSHNQV